MSIATFTFTKFKKVSLIILFASIAASCDLFYNEGEWKTELRSVSDYQSVSIESVSEIYYHYCDTFAIEVHYYDKQLGAITTKVHNNKLSIKNNFSGEIYTDIRNPEIHLYAPTLDVIKTEKETGSGFFCMDTIFNTRIDVEIYGDLIESELLTNTDTLSLNINKSAGSIKMKGIANKCNILNSGEAIINARPLKISNLTITHQSSVGAKFTVTNNLNYRIIRSGNLYIWGNPQITGEALGTGKLVLK